MIEPRPGPGGGCRDEQAFDMLAELERNTPDEIRRMRTQFRVMVKSRVLIQPGNASELTRLKYQGVTGDLSEGGCRILVPLPVTVGDVFRLSFDRKVLDLPLTYSQCVRCIMLKDDAFEVGFRFFVPITLPESLIAQFAANA